MYIAFRFLLCSSMLLGLSELSMFAQTASGELSPAARQRAEAFLRSRAEFPPASDLSFKMAGRSELAGFDKLSVHFASALTGTSGDIPLLISTDGSRLAQFTAYDIASDPRDRVPSVGRPARGGPESAPVIVVDFDDLECPHCANLHKELFPALTDHYKDQVRVVYQSVPSEGHPWAMRAAIDTDCLGARSSSAYWAAVDTIHQHASEYGGDKRQIAVANEQLDAEVLTDGQRFHVNEQELRSCIKQQDKTPEQQSVALATSLGVGSTPTVFVNGAKFEGDVPISFVFDMVDHALQAEGKVPPPRDGKTEQTRSSPAPK